MSILLNFLVKFTTRNNFHNNVIAIFISEIFIHLDNVRMVQRLVNLHFVLEDLLLIWIESILGYNLESTLCSSGFVDA